MIIVRETFDTWKSNPDYCKLYDLFMNNGYVEEIYEEVKVIKMKETFKDLFNKWDNTEVKDYKQFYKEYSDLMIEYSLI